MTAMREHASQTAFATLAIESLRAGREVRLRVQGASMRPWLPEGTAVYLAPATLDSVRPGDVVLYRAASCDDVPADPEGRPAPPRLVLHRVLRLAGRRPRTQCSCRGDAAMGPFEQVAAAELLGRVIALEDPDGRRQPYGAALRLRGRLWHAAPRLRRWMRAPQGDPAAMAAADLTALPPSLQDLIALCNLGLGLATPGQGSACDATSVRALLPDLRAHRLLPLVQQGLRRSGFDNAAVPELHRLGLQWTVRDLQLRTALRSVLRGLSRQGIEALVFKGPALADRLGDGAAWRQYDDLDLLVRAAEQPAAIEHLLSVGYVWSADLPIDRVAAAARAGLEFSLWAPERRYLLEVSATGIHPYFAAIPAEAIREGAAAVDVRDVGMVLQSAPAQELVLLCVHGAKHAWHRLAWVFDVVQWLRRHGAGKELGAARAVARQWRVETMLEVGLALAGTVAPAVRVPGVLPGSPRIQTLVGQVLTNWARHAHPDALCALRPFHLAVQQGLAQRFAYHLRLALLPGHGDLRMVRLPPCLYPLYFALRPVRIMCRALCFHRRGCGDH